MSTNFSSCSKASKNGISHFHTYIFLVRGGRLFKGWWLFYSKSSRVGGYSRGGTLIRGWVVVREETVILQKSRLI